MTNKIMAILMLFSVICTHAAAVEVSDTLRLYPITESGIPLTRFDCAYQLKGTRSLKIKHFVQTAICPKLFKASDCASVSVININNNQTILSNIWTNMTNFEGSSLYKNNDYVVEIRTTLDCAKVSCDFYQSAVLTVKRGELQQNFEMQGNCDYPDEGYYADAVEPDASKETELLPPASSEYSDVVDGEKNSEEDAYALAEKQWYKKSREEILDRGFEIMASERPRGIHLDMLEKDVVRILGEPEKKTAPVVSSVTGANIWEVHYVKLGLTLGYKREVVYANSASRVWWILISSDVFDGGTAKGIRIGSTRQEIFDAYKDDIDYEDLRLRERYSEERTQRGEVVDETRTIIVGTYVGGIIFTMSDQDIVESIFIGGYPN